MSKFQIVKGITDNLTETPYVEGKVYFVYDDINSTDLSIYADIDGARRKITPTTFEEEDPKIHILTLQENENGELTTGEDESIPSYVNNNELVIVYYMSTPFYLRDFDRGFSFTAIDGSYRLYYNRNWSFYKRESYANLSDLPTNVSELNNDAGYITEETDPTVPAWAKEATKPTYTASEVGAVPFDAGQSMATLKGGISTLRFASTNTVNRYVQAYVDTNNASITLQNQYGNNYPLVSNVQLKGIASPQDSKDAANKDYVDNAVSDKMTSTEVNSAIATAIGNINQFNVAIVSTLPTENIDNHTIYFMSNGGSDDNIYDEWMYINNNWEKIGTTSIDLSGYMQTSHPANDITSTDISNWNSKTSNTGTVTSVGLTNATDSGLTISGSPVTNSGSITVGHSNVLSSAQTTQAVYPIKIDKNGHISAYGSAVTITDEKVKQTPLNGSNSFKGLLFNSSVGNSETTNTVYTSNKIMWNDYGPELHIYNSDGNKHSALTYRKLYLGNSSTDYHGSLITADITTNTSYVLPDKSGTVALTSDIPNISETDINNWNAKVSDDKTWNGVTLDKTTGMGGSNIYVPYTTSTNASKMNYWRVSEDPTNYAIAKYDDSSYLYSTTPSANDNSTKVATTAYVNAAIPDVSGYVSKSGDTMNGRLTLAYSSGSIDGHRNGGLEFTGNNNTFVSLHPSGYNGDTSSYTMILRFESGGSSSNGVILEGIANPSNGTDAANKNYVDNKVPKVYSSTNTNGYLTMATLPIYDGTVE